MTDIYWQDRVPYFKIQEPTFALLSKCLDREDYKKPFASRLLKIFLYQISYGALTRIEKIILIFVRKINYFIKGIVS